MEATITLLEGLLTQVKGADAKAVERTLGLVRKMTPRRSPAKARETAVQMRTRLAAEAAAARKASSLPPKTETATQKRARIVTDAAVAHKDKDFMREGDLFSEAGELSLKGTGMRFKFYLRAAKAYLKAKQPSSAIGAFDGMSTGHPEMDDVDKMLAELEPFIQGNVALAQQVYTVYLQMVDKSFLHGPQKMELRKKIMEKTKAFGRARIE